MLDWNTKIKRFNNALTARINFLEGHHSIAIRLFNGFIEGIPDLTVDLFGKTILIIDYSRKNIDADFNLAGILEFYSNKLPWVSSILFKKHNEKSNLNNIGELLKGKTIDKKILENGIWFALDLQLNQDSSFYLDTRNLRSWAVEHLVEKRVLNTFAYTGSLGVAAKIAGAKEVIQTDRNMRFLALTKESYKLNRIPINESEFVVQDFFSIISRYKKEHRLFDCVFLDPPFFSTTKLGTIDLATNNKNLINKVRPIIAHDGWLVAINNALFVSGEDYMEILEDLCSDRYLKLEEIISVPNDIAGYPETAIIKPTTDPSPFNHSTKIAILRVFRRDYRIK